MEIIVLHGIGFPKLQLNTKAQRQQRYILHMFAKHMFAHAFGILYSLVMRSSEGWRFYVRSCVGSHVTGLPLLFVRHETKHTRRVKNVMARA